MNGRDFLFEESSLEQYINPPKKSISLYMSLCNRDLELIGSFRPVIPVIHYIRNYVIRDMSFCLRRAAISVWGHWGLTL